jgi:hypothetical protein
MAYYSFDDNGAAYGSYELFYMDRIALEQAGILVDVQLCSGEAPIWRHCDENNDLWPCDPATYEGYYWWACYPGCLPDSDLNGPYATPDEAHADANQCG